MSPITLEEAEYVAYRLVREMMDYGEPMGDFSTRFPNKLESCLGQPFITVGGNEAYPSLSNKAAVLFYLVIKDHPFENGNKRMAVMLMMYFLYKNGKFLETSPDELYELALAVAGNTAPIKSVLSVLNNVINQFLVNID